MRVAKIRSAMTIKLAVLVSLITGLLLVAGLVFLQQVKVDNEIKTLTQTKLPLYFEVNQGQLPKDVQFLSRGAGYSLILSKNKMTLDLAAPATLSSSKQKSEQHKGSRVSFMLDGAKTSQWHGEKALTTQVHYLNAKIQSTHITTYQSVLQKGVYPGIDLRYYGNPQKLEFDFVVSPNADPSQIALKFEGVEHINIAKSGDLILTLPNGAQLLHKRPLVYQMLNGQRQVIDGQYTLLDNNAKFAHFKPTQQVGFQLASYDPEQTLIIDPVLDYSAYLGGSEKDQGHAIAIDGNGDTYIIGSTRSLNFPTQNANQVNNAGEQDVFVSKVSADGSQLIYSTYIGGSDKDSGTSIAVDAQGYAYLTGNTESKDFPTQNPVQAELAGEQDAFIAKLSQDGSQLLYSSYYGGSGEENSNDISINALGQIHIVGTTESKSSESDSDDHETYEKDSDDHEESEKESDEHEELQNKPLPLKNAFQDKASGEDDVFIAKFNEQGNGLIYATYLGGEKSDEASAITLDPQGQVYIVGETESNNFPNASDVLNGEKDVFVTKLNADGSSIIFSRLLGGNNEDEGVDIELNNAGQIIVVGNTESTQGFPIVNALQGNYAGEQDAFITKLSNDGSRLLYSSYFGGSNKEKVHAVSVDAQGNIYIAGETSSLDFPQQDAVQNHFGGERDAFIAKFNTSIDTLVYSSYLGGEAKDSIEDLAIEADNSNVLLVGTTQSINQFPFMNALQAGFDGGGKDAFIAKLGNNTAPVIDSSPVLTASINKQYEYAVIASDAENDSLTYALTASPNGMSINSDTGLIQWLPDTTSDFSVSIEVSDSEGGSVSQNYTLTVSDANRAPVITSIPIFVADEGVAYRYDVNANDLDNDFLVYSLTVFPLSMTIDSQSGLITWIPATSNNGNVSIQVDDGQGGIDTQSYTIAVTAADITPPVITVTAPANNSVTNNATQIITGSLNETATLSINGTIVIVAADNSFSHEVTLISGVNNLTLNATDVSNNKNQITHTLTLDNVAPVITVTSPSNNSNTNQAQQTIVGSLSEAATLSINGANVVVAADNSFSHSVTLTAGINNLTLVAKDSANNQAKITHTLTLDNVIPVITVTSPLNGSLTNQGNIAIIGKLSEAVSLMINSQPVVVATDNSFTHNLNLSLGSNLITLSATDEVGNISQPVTVEVFLDNVAPVVTITSPENNLVTNNASQTIIGSVSEAATVTINGQAVTLAADKSFSHTLVLQGGVNNLAVVATDLAGNVTNLTHTITLNSAPVFTSTPITQTLIDQDYTYNALANDPDGDAITFLLTQAPLGMQINANTGVISWLPTTAGTFEVMLDAVDDKGTMAMQNFTVKVDFAPGAQPPGLTAIGNQTAFIGTTLTLQLAATDPDGGELVYIAEPMPLEENMTLNTKTGVFTFTPALTQVGDHTITFIASDGRFDARETITINVPAPPGVTSLRGQVLTSNDVPLAGVTLDINGVTSVTDATGQFIIQNLTVSGQVRLLVDGSTVDPALGTFATVPEVVPVISGAANMLQNPVFLLPLDVASADPVDPAVTSKIISSRFVQGLKVLEPVTLTIPPGSAIDDKTGLPFVGDIHISRVEDPSQGPQPLPADIELSAYIAIQPFGVTYPEPVPISFPNVDGFDPDTIMDFFALNHDTGKFEKIGEGRVSADGKTVDSIGGIVKSNSWHGTVPQRPVNTPDNNDDQDRNCDESENLGCEFSIETGNLSETHSLPSYYSLNKTRGLKLKYNSNNANPKPVITVQSGFGNFAPPPIMLSNELSIAGIDQGFKNYSSVNIKRLSRGQFAPMRPAIQYDAKALPTGLYNYALTMNCHFPVSRRSEIVNGRSIVQNDSNSPFGSGWSLTGLQRIHISNGGDLLVTDGAGTGLVFKPGFTIIPGDGGLENRIPSDVYFSPPTDYSVLRRFNGGFSRRMKNGYVYEFDGNGFLTRMLDRNQNITSYIYDTQGKLTSITDPVGKEFTFTYVNDRIQNISDPAGRITQFEHDSEGNLTKIIEPTSDERTFEYQVRNHLMTAQTDQRKNRKQYFYDHAGHIVRALLPDGSEPTLSPGNSQSIIDTTTEEASETNPAPAPALLSDSQNQRTDHNGNLTVTKTDLNQAPVEKIDAVGRKTLTQRDANSNPIKTTRPNGSVITRTFDNLGNATTVKEEFNGALRTYSYNNQSLINFYKNQNNHTVTINRDNKGNPVRIINHLEHTTINTYDTRGLMQTSTSPVGLFTEYTYNAEGLPETKKETPPLGSLGNIRLTQYGYDDAGQLNQLITPDLITVTITYDDKGRVKQVVDNLNQKMIYEYDEHNNLVKTDAVNSNGSLATTLRHIYDVRNRLEASAQPHLGLTESITQYQLDNNSNNIGVTDPRKNGETSQFDGVDRLTSNTHRLNGISTYEYDTNDRITKVVAPNGVITRYTYDLIARKKTESSPDRGTISYSYDLANNVVTHKYGRGIVTTYTYDELERPKTKTLPTASENVVYTYDTCVFGLGKICAINDESGSYSYSYDAFGNSVSSSRTELGVTYNMNYTYDNGDNIIATTYPSGRVVAFSRDAVRRINAVDTLVNGVAANIVNNIQYRTDNKMSQCTIGNGLVDDRNYDLQGRLLTQSLGTVDGRSYSYDENSNMLNRSTTPQNSDYAYDKLDRLISDSINGATPFEYILDLNGNRLTRKKDTLQNETYNYLNQSNKLIGHDTSKFNQADIPSEPTIERVFNDVNRYWKYLEGGILKAEYIYNSKGQRTRKIIYNADTTQTITVFHYSHSGKVISETKTDGSLIKDYIYIGNSPAAQIDNNVGNETLNYLHTDHLYTPRFATNTTGQVIWRWEGEVFGSDVANDDVDGDGQVLVMNLRFPGQYYDAESGLHYNYFRDYDPSTGRYVQSDPIGLEAGLNTYGYVGGNPLLWSDPFGLKLCKTNLPGMGQTYLDDSVAPLFQDFINKNIEDGVNVTFNEAFRTNAAQIAMQSNPNATTPAAGGTSLHEAGFAGDVNWSRIPSQHRDTVTENAREAGLNWGGNFSRPDNVHFYKEVPGGRENRSSYINEAQKDYSNGGADCGCK